jgi:hypothetical protein
MNFRRLRKLVTDSFRSENVSTSMGIVVLLTTAVFDGTTTSDHNIM